MPMRRGYSPRMFTMMQMRQQMRGRMRGRMPLRWLLPIPLVVVMMMCCGMCGCMRLVGGDWDGPNPFVMATCCLGFFVLLGIVAAAAAYFIYRFALSCEDDAIKPKNQPDDDFADPL